MEQQTVRMRESEPRQIGPYEYLLDHLTQLRNRARDGKVVLRGREIPERLCRQGYSKHYLSPAIRETTNPNWHWFVGTLKNQTGRHRHQGGLAIYIIEGSGWSIIDGVKHPWKAGDLLLLPVKPGGCEHQHVNGNPGTLCKFLGMVYLPWIDVLGNEIEQIEETPDYQKAHRGSNPHTGL